MFSLRGLVGDRVGAENAIHVAHLERTHPPQKNRRSLVGKRLLAVLDIRPSGGRR